MKLFTKLYMNKVLHEQRLITDNVVDNSFIS